MVSKDEKRLTQIRVLALELTRKCNARCGHCMRGEPQDKVMSNATIDKVNEVITELNVTVGDTLLSGGEPSLVPDKIKHCVDTLKYSGFSMVTNSVDVTPEFLDTLGYIKSHADLCLNISATKWHRRFQSTKLVEELERFCRVNHIYCYKKTEIDKLVKSGRAASMAFKAQNIVNYKEDNRNPGFMDFMGNGFVYIDVDGNILIEPEGAYKDYDKYKLGNVHDTQMAVKLLNKGLPGQHIRFTDV